MYIQVYNHSIVQSLMSVCVTLIIGVMTTGGHLPSQGQGSGPLARQRCESLSCPEQSTCPAESPKPPLPPSP